jgi:hypothetical protein
LFNSITFLVFFPTTYYKLEYIVYLCLSDSWYSISLSGKLREIQNRKKSIYNNSLAATGFAQFRDKDAYIIVDDMAINRLGGKFLEILKDEHELVYNDHK